mgnify:CR=1 FL=1
MSEIDVYTEKHNYFWNISMTLKRTFLGGTFTVLFLITAVLVVMITFTNYVLNNVVETKALVPSVTIAERYDVIEARFEIALNLIQYKGLCVDADGNCAATNTVKFIAIKGIPSAPD